ncbi:MAG: sigma-70 family RNA polymerase sigma factor [Bacteroidetes bacterium]|nr:sigma-70 family RNA polymerase sigma factor [Bacteroidota bacterium]
MNDLQLWQNLKKGDKKALDRIYSDHITALLKYGNKFSSNEQFVEDCMQELFIELWKKRENLGDTDSIRRYLFVSIRRKVIRQLKRKREVNVEVEEQYFHAEISIDEELIGKEITSEQSEKLKSALDKLSKRQQEAIYLKYYSGLNYKDIGEVMNINYQSVRNLVFNALKALKKYMLGCLLFFFNLYFFSP